MLVVVHIKFRFNGSSDRGALGKGVVISPDGFIATNNHVVKNASAIDFILPHRRTLSASLIAVILILKNETIETYLFSIS